MLIFEALRPVTTTSLAVLGILLVHDATCSALPTLAIALHRDLSLDLLQEVLVSRMMSG